MAFKEPLLAPQDDPLKNPKFFEMLPYPLMVSPKYDGIRAVIKKNKAMSRKMKVHRSYQVQELFTDINDLDGELIHEDVTNPLVYNMSYRLVSSFNNPGPVKYYVFDYCNEDWFNKPFYERLEKATSLIKFEPDMHAVPHKLVKNYDELIEEENRRLQEGYEGVMMRVPDAPYVTKRATMLDQIIYKLKRFEDGEALVIGFEEGTTNKNALTYDERGYAHRSGARDGLEGANTLGTILAFFEGQDIRVAPGAFSHSERDEIWRNRDAYIGKALKIRFMRYGVLNLPRFPRAIGWRDSLDF